MLHASPNVECQLEPLVRPRDTFAWSLAAYLLSAAILDCVLLLLLVERGHSPRSAHLLSWTGGLALAGLHLISDSRWDRRSTLHASGGWAILIGGGAVLLRAVLLESLWAAPATVDTADLLFVALTGWLVMTLGSTAEAASSPTAPAGPRSYLVLGYAFALMTALASALPLIKEESYYWSYGQHLALSYVDHPPLIGWLIAASTALLGDTELAVRLPSLLCWLVTMLFMASFARHQIGLEGVLPTLLFLTLPFYFGTGLLAFPDAPLMAAWAGCLYAMDRALVGGHRRAWLLFGLCLGVGLLAKYTMILLLPVPFVVALLDRKARRTLLSPHFAIALTTGATLLAPVVLWNASNDWISFRYQGPQRWAPPYYFGLPYLVLAAVVILTPVGVYAVGRAVVRPPAPAAGETLSLAHRRLARLALLVPLSVFVLNALIKNPKINWTGPVWLAALPMATLLLLRLVDRNGRRCRWWLLPTLPGFAMTVLLLLGSALLWRAMGAPGRSLHAETALMPWRELGQSVATVRAATERDGGGAAVVVGMDVSELAAQLSFYDPSASSGASTTSWHLFGGWSEGFSYWHPPEQFRCRTVILVGFQPQDLAPPDLESYFDRLGPSASIDTASSRGGRSGRLYYRVGYGYQRDQNRATCGSNQPPTRPTLQTAAGLSTSSSP